MPANPTATETGRRYSAAEVSAILAALAQKETDSAARLRSAPCSLLSEASAALCDSTAEAFRQYANLWPSMVPQSLRPN